MGVCFERRKKMIYEADLDGTGMLNDESENPFLKNAKKISCLIRYSGKKGTGFFCKIPYKDDVLPVLITVNHVYPQAPTFSENKIEITVNGKPKIISLAKRKKWTNEKMDFTCIEINEYEDEINGFFDLDNMASKSCDKKDYLNKDVTIYGINRYNDDKLAYSFGSIKKVLEKEGNFFHSCNTFPGCSGGCIVIKNKNSVIGIHRGGHPDTKLNIGIYMQDVIEFLEKNWVNYYSYNLL